MKNESDHDNETASDALIRPICQLFSECQIHRVTTRQLAVRRCLIKNVGRKVEGLMKRKPNLGRSFSVNHDYSKIAGDGKLSEQAAPL